MESELNPKTSSVKAEQVMDNIREVLIHRGDQLPKRDAVAIYTRSGFIIYEAGSFKN